MSLPRLIQVEARAKLNLGLAIGPRRPDGFHELATIFQTVSLADTLVAERRTRGFSLEVRHENAAVRGAVPVDACALVPAGPRNLAFRAAQLAARHAGLRGGVHLRLVKRIPAQAGLGGGSADAAAALVAVFALCGARVPLADRLALGAELGADVPFALLGGAALGLGRGDRLTKLAAGLPFRAVIAVPRWRVPTARAFRDFDQLRYGLTRWKAKLRCAKAVGSMALEPQRALRVGNAFEEVLGARRSSFIGLCGRLREAGLVQPHLTGSGSAVFGLLEPHASAGKALARFRGGEVIYLVRSARRALEIRRLS
jgi:4-diphosphocytidyl-2-C-methyl-D-erythritol kinase